MDVGVNTRLLTVKYHTGIQNYIKNLYQSLEKFADDKYHYLQPTFPRNVVQNAFYDLISIGNLASNYDVFHSPHGVLPLIKKKTVFVSTVHDLGSTVHADICPKNEVIYNKFVWKNILRHADLITVDSESVKGEVLQYYPLAKNRLTVVPLGIDPYFFIRESAAYLQKIRHKYKLRNTKVIYVNGAHSIRKNIRLAIESIEKINDVVLVIGGTTGVNKFKESLHPAVKDKIRAFDYLTKREVRAFYQIADLFIYPSFYEGFGLPILEAMSSQSVIIASAIPPIMEMGLDQDWLFSPTNAKQLADKINYYINISSSQRKSLITKYQPIIKKYTWQNTAKQMHAIFSGKFKL